MLLPQIPLNEDDRLESLLSYEILDSLPEDEYDEITDIASYICNTPTSVISFLDDKRQWFKSHKGLETAETPRDVAFCAHTINTPEHEFIVKDAKHDERFYDNPLVTGELDVSFYAGIPLVNAEGFALGVLCVIDNKPRKLNNFQIKILKSLAKQVIKLLELRKKTIQLGNINKKLEGKNEELQRFAAIAAHDLKSPLNNIMGFSKIIIDDYSKHLNDEVLEYINYIYEGSNHLRTLIDGILTHTKSDNILNEEPQTFNWNEFIKEITSLIQDKTVHFNYPKKDISITTKRVALDRIFLNLLSNAVKYNDKSKAIIDISFSENNKYYFFSITDNGPGIDSKHIDKIFQIFTTFAKHDKYGQKGNGIGLATVEKLVEGLNGDISVESVVGEGTQFSFKIQK